MRVELEETGSSRKAMRIEAAWDEVGDDYADIVNRFSKARVPGFRPGKAPREIIEQRFASEILEEVRSQCARRLWRDALDEHGLSMVGVAEISEMDFRKGEGFTFKAEFDVIPDFRLPAYRGLKLTEGADESTWRDEISRFLLENTEFKLPDSFIDSEMGGEDPADPAYQDARQGAEARVKLMVILKRIARDDGIEVDDRDMEERIAAIAEAEGTTPKLLKNELSARGGLGRLRDFLLAEMVLAYIIENARQ
jgi:FKBP-type peptidyl-prolyl cis-trans isomerase (trigger factor)